MYKFNGSGKATVCGVTDILVTKCNDDAGSAELKVTTADSEHDEYEADIDDPKITFDALGADALERGDIGATELNWNDGGVTNLGDTVLTGKQKAGSVGDKIVYSLTVRATKAAAS